MPEILLVKNEFNDKNHNKKHFTSRCSNRVVDWTVTINRKVELPKNILEKRNLSSGLVCFDLSSDISRKLIEHVWIGQKIKV